MNKSGEVAIAFIVFLCIAALGTHIAIKKIRYERDKEVQYVDQKEIDKINNIISNNTIIFTERRIR